MFDCSEFSRLLFYLNSSVNDVATDGTTPLYLATQDGNLDCLKYLHSVGGKCDGKARDGMLPIHGAAQNGHLDCVGYLVRCTCKNVSGSTILRWHSCFKNILLDMC